MIKTRCPLCETEDNATLLYRANLSGSPDLIEMAFSARHSFDAGRKLNYRIVKCRTCGQVRSDPVFELERILDLYQDSEMLYEEDSDDIASVYLRYLIKTLKYVPERHSLLDIGCGNGFFMKRALAIGFADVRGIEPSRPVYESTEPWLRPKIVPDTFKKGVFLGNTFDVVCLFQTLEHLVDPNATVAEIFNLLKPGGMFLALNHNVRALSARLLGVRSPIFEIVHVNFFDAETMTRLFRKHDFAIKEIHRVWHSYRFRYWLKYVPFGSSAKGAIGRIAEWLHIANIHIPLPAGNIAVIAQKPLGPYIC